MLRSSPVIQASFKHGSSEQWLQCSALLVFCCFGGFFFFVEGGFSAKFFPVAVFSILQHQHCYGAVIRNAFKESEIHR